MYHFNVKQHLSVFFFLFIIAFSSFVSAATQNADGTWTRTDGWAPIQGGTQDGALEVDPGTILDFSSITSNNPITEADRLEIRDGKFYKVGATEPMKFLIGGWMWSYAEGKFPDEAKIDRYVDQFVLGGYNMIRFHFLDDTFMFPNNRDENGSYYYDKDENGQNIYPEDFEFNQEQVDRFHYLVEQLKENGIYIMVDGLTSGQGGFGNRYQRANLKTKVFFEDAAKAHWKQLVESMYGDLINDPVLAGIILVNENPLDFTFKQELNGANTELRTELKPGFNRWLAERYQTRENLLEAWGAYYSGPDAGNKIYGLRESENFDDGTVELVNVERPFSARMADTQRYFNKVQNDTVTWMRDYLSIELNYPGYITSYNNSFSKAGQMARKTLDWVDAHAYFAHPSLYTQVGSVISQASMLNDKATYIQWLAAQKQVDKPFTVSEHGAVFWNKYRYEAGLALPSYAALQGWDGISQHTMPVELNYTVEKGQRKEAIYPFVAGFDPISKATETLSALLYLRSDVNEANSVIGANLETDYAFDHGEIGEYGIYQQSRYSLITGFMLDIDAQASDKYDAQITVGKSGKLHLIGEEKYYDQTPFCCRPKPDDKSDKPDEPYNEYYDFYVIDFMDAAWQAGVTNLRDAGLIDSINRTNAENGVFESDTKELLLDSNKKQMIVNTAKTEGVAFDIDTFPSGGIPINHLHVKSADGRGLVAVSALDVNSNGVIEAKDLIDSERMLLVLATDALNSGMTFADETGKTLANLGTQPVLIRPNAVTITLENNNSANLAVRSVNFKGQPQDNIPVIRTGCDASETVCSGIEFTLDIRNLTQSGPTTYFQITKEMPKLELLLPQNNVALAQGKDVTFQASVLDNSNLIKSVGFYSGEQLIGARIAMTQSPTLAFPIPSDLASGTYPITVKAFDALEAGNEIASSETINVRVGPVITSPQDNAEFSIGDLDPITFSVDLPDTTGGIASVSYSAGGQPLGFPATEAPYSISFTIPNVEALKGTYPIIATVRDNDGNLIDSPPITVIVK